MSFLNICYVSSITINLANAVAEIYWNQIISYLQYSITLNFSIVLLYPKICFHQTSPIVEAVVFFPSC
jgi:hypothetical protein